MVSRRRWRCSLWRRATTSTAPSASQTGRGQSYSYDALGRRISKTTYTDGVASSIYYLYDGHRVVEEVNGFGEVIASYVYGNYIDEVLRMDRDLDGLPGMEKTFYYLRDDQYNVLSLVDADNGNIAERYVYGAFGEPLILDASGDPVSGVGSAIGNRYMFNGREYDADTGLYWYRTRYMDPKLGRFIARDTIGLWGDENNLGNPYSYVGNNPWSRLDPFGEASLEEILPVYEFLYGDTGTNMLNAFYQEGGEISMEGVVGQVDFQQDPRRAYGPRFEIELEDSIDAFQAAQYLWSGLSEASGQFQIARHLLNTDDIDGYRGQLQNGLAQMRANAEQGAQNYLYVLSALNEGADWATITADLSEGEYTSLVGVLPLVSASLVKAGKGSLNARFRFNGPDGMVDEAFAKIEKKHLGTGTGTTLAGRLWARFMGGPGDDAGHLIGRALGGLGGKNSGNLIPQNLAVNRGAYNQFEQFLRHQVSSGKDVFLRIRPRYNPGSTRPHTIDYYYRIDNQTYLKSFDNP